MILNRIQFADHDSNFAAGPLDEFTILLSFKDMGAMIMVADTPSMFVEMSFNILRGKFVKMDYIDENLVEC